jgi:hypothetical protein
VGGSATLARARSADPLPWAVAAIALVALIALIAGQRFGSGRNSATVEPPPAVAAPGQAPNLANLTPREITDRLYNRVMMLHEQGLTDSLKLIAQTMAIPAFELHDSLDVDLRYDLGRIAEVSGEVALARAQADTILRQQPTHLLGLILSANVARIAGDSGAVRALQRRLLDSERAELARSLREYSLHKVDIDRALAEAKGGR